MTSLDDTTRGTRGFRSTDTRRIEIDEISTKTFDRTKEEGDTYGLIWGRYDNGKLKLLSTNVSTELAIRSKKKPEEEDFPRNSSRRVLGLSTSFWGNRGNDITPSSTRSGPRNQNRKRQKVALKEDIPIGSQRIRRVRRIHTNKQTKKMDPRFIYRRRITNNICQKKRMVDFDYMLTIEDSTVSPRKTDIHYP